MQIMLITHIYNISEKESLYALHIKKEFSDQQSTCKSLDYEIAEQKVMYNIPTVYTVPIMFPCWYH